MIEVRTIKKRWGNRVYRLFSGPNAKEDAERYLTTWVKRQHLLQPIDEILTVAYSNPTYHHFKRTDNKGLAEISIKII